MSEEDFKPLDLTDPDDCREFLESLIVEGKPVTRFHTSTGRKLTIDQMTDKEAISFANQMHDEMFGGDEYVDVRQDKRQLN